MVGSGQILGEDSTGLWWCGETRPIRPAARRMCAHSWRNPVWFFGKAFLAAAHRPHPRHGLQRFAKLVAWDSNPFGINLMNAPVSKNLHTRPTSRQQKRLEKASLAVPLHNLAQACAHVDAASWHGCMTDSWLYSFGVWGNPISWRKNHFGFRRSACWRRRLFKRFAMKQDGCPCSLLILSVLPAAPWWAW